MPYSDGGKLQFPAAAEEEAALLPIIRRLSGARSQDEIMAVTSHAVRTLLHADGATFVLRDGDRCYYAEEDAVSPLWKGRRFPMSACISGWVMTNRKPVAIADIYKDPRIPADAYRPTFVKSLAMAPVGVDEPLAALGAYWSAPRQPHPRQVELLAAIADAAALAVANVQLRTAQPARARAKEKPAPVAETEPAPRSSPRAFLERLRHANLRPNSLEAFAFVALCVLAATLVREGFKASGVRELAVFSTYYPAVLIATLAGGRRAGLLAALTSGLAAYYFFMPPLYRFVTLDAADALNLALFGGASALIILIIDWHKRAVARLREEDAKHLSLAREQRHRVKNAISIAEVVVRQSLQDEPERARTINHRIRAGLAEIDMQERSHAAPVVLRDLLGDELQPYDLARFALEGDLEADIPPALRSLLALGVHELATNALKYGALSVPEGRVAVTGRVQQGRLAIAWRETGGPPAQPPRRRGYGSIMLRRLVEAAGGAIAMDFPPAGLTAEIALPIAPVRRT